jgi:hypothetical protein
MAFSLSGNVRDVPLPLILQILQQVNATGTLTVRSSGVEKRIHFKNGQIIFASSTEGNDRLGEMLVKAGLLSRENLEAALKLFHKNAGLKKFGAILVENGFVSPKNLFAGLKTQVKDIIYSLFLWDDAEYRFGEGLPPDVIQLQINIPELITEIIERIKREA